MKTGLVLEGGAFRTIFSSGACDGLLEGNIMTDYVIGVSAGIAYGVSYVSRQKGRNLEILTRYGGDKRYMGFGNMLRRDNRRCYFGLKFVFEDIPNELIPFDYDAFAAFPGTTEAVLTDLNTGEAVYKALPRRDRRFDLLQATCALPFLFPSFDVDGAPCMDGGASDAIPYRRAFQQGCDRVLVILTRERDYVRRPEKLQPLIDLWYRKYPKFCDTLRHRYEVYNADRAALFRLEREGKVYLLAPKSTEGFSRTERDTDKIRALWQDGWDQALEQLPAIRAFLSGEGS